MKRFTLREVLGCVRDGALAGEVNSVLHKLVNIKGVVVRDREHNGVRIVNVYQWKLPNHGR